MVQEPRPLGVQAVVLDANALLLPFQFRVNLQAELRRLLGEHEIFVPSPVLDELKGLSKSVPQARAALKLASRFQVYLLPGEADQAVVDAALRLKAVVCTYDAVLLRSVNDAPASRYSL